MRAARALTARARALALSCAQCGIVAYLGTAQAKPILLGGLARLEYRGYDSAGLAVMQRDAVAEGEGGPSEPSPTAGAGSSVAVSGI